MERTELWKQRNYSRLEKSEQNLKLKHTNVNENGERRMSMAAVRKKTRVKI